MNTKAIERIKGYACEVTQEQWEELVRVADEVGCEVGKLSRGGMIKPDRFARYNSLADVLGVYRDKYSYQEEISFPDFLAKLKGEEKWQPKAGEIVEVSHDSKSWHQREFIACKSNVYVCWFDLNDSPDTCYWRHIRPFRPTITRVEAEAKLNARIID
jgi:hypothetical protein